MATIHHEQISRVRISVEEAVFEELLEIRANQHPVDLHGRYAIRAQSFKVNYFRAANKIERQHSRVRVRPVDLRHTNRAPRAEVVAKPVCVTSFLDVVHLFEDG